MSRASTACPDWRERLADLQPLVPELPLDEEEGDRAVRIFDRLRLPDVTGQPRLGEVNVGWYRPAVRVLFGSYNNKTGKREIATVHMVVPKKQGKTTLSGGTMVTALLMNRRPNARFGIVGSTQKISQEAYDAAAGMVEADPKLKKVLKAIDHTKTIEHRLSGAYLNITSFDPRVATGGKFAGCLIDELHVLGSQANAARVIGQIRGARAAIQESFVWFITTQSEDQPAGVFETELQYARGVRDGLIDDPTYLPIIYEFPRDVQTDPSRPWEDPALWPQVMPGLGGAVSRDVLVDMFREAKQKGESELRRWASQHLNIEVGLALSSNYWIGAEFWDTSQERVGSLEDLKARCEVIVVGIDGGGLDDLLGLTALGRELGTGRWLAWSRAWAHKIVLERRKEIAPRLLDFEKEGTLTIVEMPGADIVAVADIVCEIEADGLLAEKQAVAVDSVGIVDIVNELTSEDRGIALERIVGISQGWKLSGAIKTTERKLAGGELVHDGSALMAWCIGNAKCEPRGNAVTITKQASGSAKIDPLMSLFNAVSLMATNPQPRADRALDHAIVTRGGFA